MAHTHLAIFALANQTLTIQEPPSIKCLFISSKVAGRLPDMFIVTVVWGS